MNNQLTTAKPLSLSSALASAPFQNAIHNALNDAAKEKKFISSVISASTVNPVLQECTPKSVLSVALLGESLNLCPSPQLGQYYFVPYDLTQKGKDGKPIPLLDDNGNQIMKYGKPVNRTVKVAQFQIGYKGYIQLALRSGYYKKLNVMSVKKDELIHWDPMNEEISLKLIDDYEQREAAETVGYFAMFEYLNGFRKAMYWSRKKMEVHALRYSKGYAARKGYTFWEKDFDGMAYKTMLRQLISKWGIMSTELQAAFENDVVEEQSDTTSTPPSGPENPPFPDAPDMDPVGDENSTDEPADTPPSEPVEEVSIDDLP